MNMLSGFIGFILFFALLYGAMTIGVILPCGVLLPAIAGGLVVGLAAK